MTDWTEADLLRLDLGYAQAGVTFHARPMRAAEDILGNRFVLGPGDNSEVQAITQAYRRLIPETKAIWPGMGIGLVASIDQVRKVTVPVIFGTVDITPEESLGFDNREDWLRWCRDDPTIAANGYFAFADLYDLTYGLQQLRHSPATAIEYWHMALSNLEDVTNILTTAFSVDSVLQPICMTAELAMKAALIYRGADPEMLGRRDVGHNHKELARRMAAAMPHGDDVLVAAVAASLPDYVGSRYKSAGLSRLDVVRLALGVQFIAASSVRRLTGCDLASEMERDTWPGPRGAYLGR